MAIGSNGAYGKLSSKHRRSEGVGWHQKAEIGSRLEACAHVRGEVDGDSAGLELACAGEVAYITTLARRSARYFGAENAIFRGCGRFATRVRQHSNSEPEAGSGHTHKFAVGHTRLGGRCYDCPTHSNRDCGHLPMGQALWLKELETYINFPPLQNPASYNLDQVMQQVKDT